MAKKFISLLAATAVIGIATLFAQERTAKAGEGTLMVQDKNYPLTHALAYETTIDDAEMIAVVLSGQAISSEKLKEAKEAEKEGQDADFQAALSQAGVHQGRGTQASGAPVLATLPWAGGPARRPGN